jgi:hypothetical protein
MKKKQMIIGLVLLSLTIAIVTIAVGRPERFWPSRRLTPLAAPRPTPAQSQTRADDPVQNIRFTLYEEGIKPSEITVQKGLISIVLEDRTRKSEGLMLTREVGNNRTPVGQVKRSGDFWRGRNEVRLTPGNYRVSDSGNPTHWARLIVLP